MHFEAFGLAQLVCQAVPAPGQWDKTWDSAKDAGLYGLQRLRAHAHDHFWRRSLRHFLNQNASFAARPSPGGQGQPPLHLCAGCNFDWLLSFQAGLPAPSHPKPPAPRRYHLILPAPRSRQGAWCCVPFWELGPGRDAKLKPIYASLSCKALGISHWTGPVACDPLRTTELSHLLNTYTGTADIACV